MSSIEIHHGERSQASFLRPGHAGHLSGAFNLKNIVTLMQQGFATAAASRQNRQNMRILERLDQRTLNDILPADLVMPLNLQRYSYVKDAFGRSVF